MRKTIILLVIIICNNSIAQIYDTAVTKYSIVKTWQGPVNIRINQDSEGMFVANESKSIVTLTNEIGGIEMFWPFPDITKASNADYSIHVISNDGCTVKINSSGQMPCNILLGLNMINKTYYLHCTWPVQVDANVVATCDGEVDEKQDMANFYPGEVEIKEYPIDMGSPVPILKGNTTFTVSDLYTVTADWDLRPLTGSTVTIDPIDENWLPENNSVITTKLHWDAENTATNLRFTLYDISSEPGTCLNDINGEKTLDLSFDSNWVTENHYEITSQTEDEIIVQRASLELNNELTIAIKSLDYGAYGKLKAEVMIDGEWRTAVVAGGSENFVSIPVDKNANHIADKWEKDVGVFAMDLSEGWDEDPEPAGQRRNGDGYVLYEEYRGFNAYDHLLKKPDNVKIDGMHFRSDPMFKDVFVFAEGFSFKSMYHSNPANLNWHLITSRDMIYSSNPEIHRWVNNKSSRKYFYANQYAVYVEVLTEVPNWDNTDEAAGITFWFNEVYKTLDSKLEQECLNHTSPLKCHSFCFIYLDNIYNAFFPSNYIPGNITEIIMHRAEKTLIHEIGHFIGIPHHGGQNTIGEDVNPSAYEPPECVMRYTKKGEFITFSDYEMWLALESHYCNSGRFNCYANIDVKCDP